MRETDQKKRHADWPNVDTRNRSADFPLPCSPGVPYVPATRETKRRPERPLPVGPRLPFGWRTPHCYLHLSREWRLTINAAALARRAQISVLTAAARVVTNTLLLRHSQSVPLPKRISSRATEQHNMPALSLEPNDIARELRRLVRKALPFSSEVGAPPRSGPSVNHKVIGATTSAGFILPLFVRVSAPPNDSIRVFLR